MGVQCETGIKHKGAAGIPPAFGWGDACDHSWSEGERGRMFPLE